jgi:hypothetical protein
MSPAPNLRRRIKGLTWLVILGLIACVLLIPYALVFGALRGIPFWWRLIDCSFGVLGFVPLWFCRKWSRKLEAGIPAPQRA